MPIPSVSYTFTPTFANRGGTSNEIGTRGYENDGSDATYWGSYVYTGGDNDFGNTNTLVLTYTFSAPTTVTQIRFKAFQYLWGTTNNYESNGYTCTLKVYDWNNAATTLYSFSGGGKGNYTNDTGVVLDVTVRPTTKKIEVIMYGRSNGDDTGGSQHMVYDLSFISYDASGLQYTKNGTTYKIGYIIGNSTSKLKLRKGAGTISIPLVATTALNASAIRIYDGISIKALPIVS